MKVIHVETGRHLYGGAQQVLYLLQGLAGDGDEHILVCPRGSAIAQTAGAFARVHSFPMRSEADLRLFTGLFQLIRHEHPHLVHIHSRRGADVWGGLAARLAGTPAVLTRRVDNPEPRWRAKLKYGLYRRVITISQGISDVLRREGVPEDKLVCVPSAVDTERFQPGCDTKGFREAFEIDASELVVGMLAQFIARKGHQVLIDAVPRVLEAHPQTRFLLFGKGPLEPKVRQALEQEGLAERARLCGFRDDMDRILPCLDVLVHPADMEGLGVSLLQAAACGVPIVAARVGGIPEIVGHEVNGLLVEPGNPPALAQALKTLLDDSHTRRRYGAAGRRIAMEHFAIDHMIAGNKAVYRQLCPQSQG